MKITETGEMLDTDPKKYVGPAVDPKTGKPLGSTGKPAAEDEDDYDDVEMHQVIVPGEEEGPQKSEEEPPEDPRKKKKKKDKKKMAEALEFLKNRAAEIVEAGKAENENAVNEEALHPSQLASPVSALYLEAGLINNVHKDAALRNNTPFKETLQKYYNSTNLVEARRPVKVEECKKAGCSPDKEHEDDKEKKAKNESASLIHKYWWL